MFKCGLDCLLAVGAVDDAHLSRWPTRCTGYKKYLQLLHPGVPSKEHLQCFYHFYFHVSHPHRLRFNEACAQLCWMKRRDDNSLMDSA